MPQNPDSLLNQSADSLPGLFDYGSREEFWNMVGAAGDAIAAVVAIALLVVAIIGLRSLNIAKRDIATRNKREARTSAIERAREFADEIIPANGKILTAFAEKKIPVFAKDASAVVFGPEEKKKVGEAHKWFATLPPELRDDTIQLLNRLESWAMHFIHALADSKMAYGPCAPIYCTIVMQLYPVLVFYRNDESSGDYPNVVHLFEAWYEPKRLAENNLKRQELFQQLVKLQTKGPKPTLPNPLGTD